MKFGEETSLKFQNDKLNELSEECKKYHVGKLVQYCKYTWGVFNYLSKQTKNQNDFSLLNVFNQHKHTIPLMVKSRYMKRFIEQLGQDEKSVSVHINRKKAKEFFDKGKSDDKYEHTIFAQVQRGLAIKGY